MDIEITTDVQGLAKKFDNYAGKIYQAADRAVKKSAFLVERYAKILTPVATGRLRGSISADMFPLYASISPNTDYAIFVHQGTRFMHGRPFMFQGANQAKNEINDIFAKEIGEAIK